MAVLMTALLIVFVALLFYALWNTFRSQNQERPFTEFQHPPVQTVADLLLELKFARRPEQLQAKRTLMGMGPAAVPELEAARTESHPWVRRQIDEILDHIQNSTTGAGD